MVKKNPIWFRIVRIAKTGWLNIVKDCYFSGLLKQNRFIKRIVRKCCP